MLSSFSLGLFTTWQAGRDRARAAPTFGAEGLYLEKIEYEARWGLPQLQSNAERLVLES